MPTPAEMITGAAVLMNDAAQKRYTNTAVLPYLNMSLDILQEVYELHSLPITEGVSSIITVPSGISRIGFDTIPALPTELIEIQQMWESPTGLNEWTPMVKKEYLPHFLEDGTLISQFLIWAWNKDHIELIPANATNDVKLDMISKIFKTPIALANVNVNLPFTNIKTYIEFETAALCAMFIAENETRYATLSNHAADALSRALGIPIKGMQSVVTRRRPFRASFKRRGISY